MQYQDEPDIKFEEMDSTSLRKNTDLNQTTISYDPLSQSLMKIRNNAKQLESQRKYDPKKYSNVQSKIGRNLKVINTTNKYIQQRNRKQLEQNAVLEEALSRRFAGNSLLSPSPAANKSFQVQKNEPLSTSMRSMSPNLRPATAKINQSAISTSQKRLLDTSARTLSANEAEYFNQIKNAKKGYKSPYKRDIKAERNYMQFKSAWNVARQPQMTFGQGDLNAPR